MRERLPPSPINSSRERLLWAVELYAFALIENHAPTAKFIT
jgi:hypothetical protein